MSFCLSVLTMNWILTDNDNSLKYVKSAKASTDVPSTVSLTAPVLFLGSQLRLTSNILTSGSRIYLSTSTLAKRLPLCLDSRYSIFLQNLDIRPKLFPKNFPPGIYISYPISISWRVNHVAHFWNSTCLFSLAGIHLQRRATRVHLDITCKLLPCLLLCELCDAFLFRHNTLSLRC